MEADIMDGTWDPSEGESARVRVLRYDDGGMTVEYPGKEVPLKVNRKDGASLEIPESPGTYEVCGEVTTTIYPVTTEEPVVHSVTLKNPDIQEVSDEVEPLPRDSYGSDGENMSAEDVDVGVNEETIPDETVEKQMDDSSRQRSETDDR
ncbi:hypothetical protein LPA44_13065 [Halobacterium sp. KA-4]|uniref:hypothetical protein n=1 Tax=Halobacterium sp. KA-4 TaxID=2896367 RepID=UPI001E3A7FE3|nr:hypothetical protein [Halobacterium sp. KA-4]MCD2200818.1 hypothetical protein [Halobacterium sp. KA-4]